MKGMEILNSFKKETRYEFSEAIPVIDDNAYIIFKEKVISIEVNPNKSKSNMLKKLMKNSTKNESFISHITIEPIAYLLEIKADENELNHENAYEYKIESIDKQYDSFVEKNKDKLLEQFLKR